MAKKKKLQPTAPHMTRGQLSRAARERQQLRNLYTAVIGVITLSVLVIGLAVFSAFVLKPNEEVAKVNGETITRATYNKLRRWDLYQQNATNQIMNPGQTQTTVDLSTQLKAVDTEALDAATLGALVDNTVLRQKAQSDLQVTAGRDELRAQAVKDFIPEPTAPPAPSTGITPTAVVTSTTPFTPTATATFTPGPPTLTPTRTPTLPPVPGGEATAEAGYSDFVKALGNGPAAQPGSPRCSQGCPGLSEDDYLNLIVQSRVLQDKVTEKLVGKEVTAAEQIHAQHILTDTPEGAQKIIDMLNKGADFTQTANTESKEQLDNIKNGGKPNGGDLGWFPETGSNYDPDFVAGAFKVQASKYTTQPVQTSFGYHVIKVLEHDPHRPLTDSEISAIKSKRFEDWFAAAKQNSTITTKIPPTPVVPTQPPAQEPVLTPEIVQPTPPPQQPVTGTNGGGKTPMGTPVP